MIYFDHLLKATQGTVHYNGQHEKFVGFNQDTRQIQPGEMFVAVRGERGNGHDYLFDALHRGATGIMMEAREHERQSGLLSRLIENSDATILLVEDTRVALQQYARMILQLWHPVVIAVAGSVGKTSTKEAIATVLSNQFKTFRSWQNYNDLLGIPLSLGRLEAEHEYAVLELGCDHPGEIADLCKIVQPTIAILTNINPVQLQYFGTLERMAIEMGTLITCLPAGGDFFFNQDDPQICALVTHYLKQNQTYPSIHIHTFAAPHSSSSEQDILPPIDRENHQTKNYHAELLSVDWNGVTCTLTSTENDVQSAISGREENKLMVPLLGAHHLNTLLAAYQVGINCGIPANKVQQALTEVIPQSGRLKPITGIRTARLLDDTHNASPASLQAGLRALHTLTPATGRRIAVLGDMLHLGDYEGIAHHTLGKEALHYVDYLITKGERAAILAESALQAGLPHDRIIMTSTHEDAAQAVRRILDRRPATTATPSESKEHFDVVLIKGSEEARMERVTELLMNNPWEAPDVLVRQTPGWKKTFFTHAERPTWVEIDLNAIGSNTRHIKSLVGTDTRVLVALKADAYGHGALKVARTVLQNGATMLGVATVSEAIPLRKANITAPILSFGYVPHWQMREAIRLNVSATLYTIESARELSRAAQELARTIKVHIKVDTGMNRLGILSEQIDEILELLRAIKHLPGLELEGIYTHFAKADDHDQTHARMQLSRFYKVLQRVEAENLRPPIVHASNSAALLTLPEARFDMVRPGIAIYGLEPSPDVQLPEGFRAALSFKTQVSQVKWLPAGETISYGGTYTTEKPTCVATLPVGYADGFRRAPRNWGSVLVHGQEAPILGRVCMDQSIVDVTDIPSVRVGDEAVLIGRQGERALTAEMIATRLGTINYEVVAEILARVPRIG